MAVQKATAYAHNQQWTEAQKALLEVERLWPGDPAAAAIRREIELAQIEAENQSLEISQGQIETEMSLSHWDQAISLARGLANQFPSSVRAITLLHRVEHEHAIYTETTVQRLFDDIRHDSERRAWRRALEHAQTLLAKFPDHPRSELIRKQIKTIQDNAEIEERQEQEARISELIRARRFREAIGLSEELLRQFPTSRQAETITKLLPRIRQLAAEEEAQSAQSSAI
jgi:outer membrane protein assembly factor BamD (BamD/ComL family)